MPGGQAINPEQTEDVREVVIAHRTLRLAYVKWILGERKDCARIGGESLRRVVDRLAEGVGSLASKAMPVLQAELALQAVVDGISSICVLDDPAEIAVRVPNWITELI